MDQYPYKYFLDETKINEEANAIKKLNKNLILQNMKISKSDFFPDCYLYIYCDSQSISRHVLNLITIYFML